jgi:CubicO group peptidase (beta-lactamase class C family)
MTAGFPGDADPRNDVGEPANLVRALLRRPVVRPPGSRFAYDTRSAHLVSAAISHETGKPAGSLAARRLFGSLGIRLEDCGAGYGYFWWTEDRRGLHSFSALGFGGQMVAVVPKLDLIVVVMSNPSGRRVDLGRILLDRVVPAVRR